VSAPGAETDVFVGNKKDYNGDKISSKETKTRSGEELNMRVTLQPST